MMHARNRAVGRALILGSTLSLAMAGCHKAEPVLTADPIDRAATCGVVTAAIERGKAGVQGQLPAAAQARIFHYALLAGAEGERFDSERANAVSARMPGLFDKTIKGKWQVLAPACATAFPQTRITAPVLPDGKLDSLMQCYVLTDFLRKAFMAQGNAYSEATTDFGALNTRLDAKVSPLLAAAGIKNGQALQDRRARALAAVARLGQPQAVVDRCAEKYE